MAARTDLDDLPTGGRPCVLTIGVFDGVHRGHQAVLTAARGEAQARRLPMIAMTFDPHPIGVVRPGAHPLLLVDLDERVARLKAAGADDVLVLHFTRQVAGLSPEEFAADVLSGRLSARAVIVGVDFRFGHRAAGDVSLLRELGTRYGFEAIALPDVGDGGHRWSSSVVRSSVAVGDVAHAASVLGRPHRMRGRVVVGDRRGRTLGFPTANVDVPEQFLRPADGVYAGWLTMVTAPTPQEPPPAVTSETESSTGPSPSSAEGDMFVPLPAAVSVGTNPTFDGTAVRLEAYVLDRTDLDLYGATVAIDFVQRLRPMERFGSVDVLKRQMAQDVARARAVLTEQSPPTALE